MKTITVIDESTAGDRTERFELKSTALQLTAAELIELRVREECRLSSRPKFERIERQQVLNSAKEVQREPDASELVERALKAFSQGAFLLLVNEQQISELNQIIPLGAASEAVFLRIIPLVGG